MEGKGVGLTGREESDPLARRESEGDMSRLEEELLPIILGVG